MPRPITRPEPALSVTARAVSPRQRTLPGTGRLGIVAAYFTLAGLGTGALTVLAGWSLLKGIAHGGFSLQTAAQVVSGCLLTVCAFQTDRLLSRRRKIGGYVALVSLSTSAIYAALGYGIGVSFATVFAVVGLALLGSVWRHLD